MKRWRKLSLLGWVAPIIASIASVSMGCSNKFPTQSSISTTEMNDDVITPQLLEFKPTIISSEPTVQQGGDSFGNDVTKQVQALNQLFTNRTILIDRLVKQIMLVLLDNQRSFTIKIFLIPGYVFQNGSNVGTSERPISYFNEVKYPKLLDDACIITVKETAQLGWDGLNGRIDKQMGGLNQIFELETAINPTVVKNIDITFLSENLFKFKLYLNLGHKFVNGGTSYTTNQTIKYATLVPTPLFSKNHTITLITSAQINSENGGIGLGNTENQVKEINKGISPETKLKVEKIKSISIEPISEQTFCFKVVLKHGYAFSNGKRIGRSPINQPMLYLPSIKKPKLTNNSSTMYGKQTSALNWWKSLHRSTMKQVTGLNQLFTKQTQLDADVVSYIDFVTVNANQFMVSVGLKDGYFFEDGTKVGYSALKNYPLHYEAAKVYQKTPEFIDHQPIIYGQASSVEAGGDNLQGDLTKQVEALNQIFTFATHLDVKAIKNIAFYPGKDDAFTVSVYLKNGYFFDDGHCDWHSKVSEKPINYQSTPNIYLRKPKYIDRKPMLFIPNKTVDEGLMSVNNDITKQVAIINQIFTPETKLDPKCVQAINFTSFPGNRCNIKVYLKDGCCFHDQTSSGTADASGNGIVYKPVPKVIVKKPVFYKPEPIIFDQKFNHRQGWGVFQDEVTKQVIAINQIFNLCTQLNPKAVKQINFWSINENQFAIDVYLKDGYIFEDGSTNGYSGLANAFISYKQLA